jgi:hypothetical protein
MIIRTMIKPMRRSLAHLYRLARSRLAAPHQVAIRGASPRTVRYDQPLLDRKLGEYALPRLCLMTQSALLLMI